MKKNEKLMYKSVSNTRLFGKYSKAFRILKKDETVILKDSESDRNSFMPIKANDEQIYVTEPDRELIPNIPNQQKCDFLIYCEKRLQVCFIELKGENISIKDEYNPFDQIIATIKFLKTDGELKGLVSENVERQAFIVSPGRQKLPKGIELKERQLWQSLVVFRKDRPKISDLVHYVKVTKSDRYSNKNQIICSPKSPVQIPFDN